GLTSHHTPFSFLLSSPHLALHSFPTRRSSDLTSKGILAGVPATSTAHRQRLEIDGTPFLFQHGYRFGKVTYITRLPLGKNMTVFTPGHLSAPAVETVVRGDRPRMLESRFRWRQVANA